MIFLILKRILVFSIFFQSGPAIGSDNPKEILQHSDRARGGVGSGIAWNVKLDSTEDGVTTSTSYHVKGQDVNAYVEVIEPARSKGEVLLFNDRTIWFYKPSLKKPVAISARQKLSGQTANGDIATTNYARDYTGKIIGEEKINNEDCWVFELKSNGSNTTYDGIKYWISKKSRLGLKAEFLSLQGKPLKIATFKYGNSLVGNGKKFRFVSEMRIVDAQNSKNYSVMTYSSPKSVNLPDSLFNVNNLLR